MPAKQKATLNEILAQSIRRLNVAGLRENVEGQLAKEDRLGRQCELSTISLLEMFKRDELVKERIIASGYDWYKLLEDFDNPEARAFHDAYHRYSDDMATTWGNWKRACMRRRPGED